jgi:UDP-N-acetylglucosamine 2-epimerase (non-hydrolysing)/GDP/UDP-N,N'-diacetylbacillosamine 2-epimerase (hydrolysing)
MRKIAVFTGSRADYGILYWLLKELDDSNDIELQLFVGGTHLSSEFGHTLTEIINDGFSILEKFRYFPHDDSTVGIAKLAAHTLVCASEAIAKNQPELMVVIGDRYETFSVAQAAMLSQVPIVHIHGGELTSGAIDDSMRHAITKMSHLHFATTKSYKQRIIQLGEQPKNVFNFGAPGLDNIDKLILFSASELSKTLKFDLTSSYFVVTFHPETLSSDGGVATLKNLFKALDNFAKYKLLITYPNADACGHKLVKMCQKYQKAQPDRVLLVKSLGQLRYLSSIKHCSAVIGNSSSGIIEAPSFQVPTVNIGERQQGRVCSSSVITCQGAKSDIDEAISRAVSLMFVNICQSTVNPYGSSGVAKNIVNKLVSISLENLHKKQFYDLRTGLDDRG